MSHPTWLDNLRLRYNPNYLYPGQLCQLAATVTVGILHPSPSAKSLIWQPVNYREIKKGSVLRFLNFAKNFPIDKSVSRWHSVMEIVSAISEVPITPGDLVIIEHQDRKYLYPAPANSSSA